MTGSPDRSPTAGSGSTASQLDNSINYSAQSLYHGFFFHDDWRVTPKLTLNLGLRYELEGGLTERFDKHRIIAKWALPLWFYVSVTGVIVYWMVYQLYAPVRG